MANQPLSKLVSRRLKISKQNLRELKAQKREVSGRKVKKLRREGLLPANIYGKKVKSQAIQVALSDFKKAFAEVGETGLVSLQVNGDKRPVLIHHVQLDPVTDLPLHADFLQVDLTEKVTARVPLEFVGESPAQKAGEGVIVHQMNEIEVEALPANLPEKIMVDISSLAAVDEAIKVGQLNIDKTKVALKDDPGRIVVNVAPPTKEEEIVPPPSAEGEAVAAEGEVPAEGAPAEAAAEGGAAAVEGAKPAEEKAPPGGGLQQPQSTQPQKKASGPDLRFGEHSGSEKGLSPSQTALRAGGKARREEKQKKGE